MTTMASSATNGFNATSSTSTTNLMSQTHCSKAYKSASEKTPDSLTFLCNFTRDNGAVAVDNRGDTVLHLLAVNGNKTALERLRHEGLLTEDLLTKRNVRGNAPLHEAARFGHKEVAEIMLRKMPELLSARNDMEETPLYLAAQYGCEDVFQVLKGLSDDCRMRRRDGRTVLHAAVDGECYCLAVSIVEEFPDLVRMFDQKGMTPLNLLITKASSFRSRSSFVFYDLTRTESPSLQLFEAIIYSIVKGQHFDIETDLYGHGQMVRVLAKAQDPCIIPAMYTYATCKSKAIGNEEDPRDKKVGFFKLERSFITRKFLGCRGLNYIDDAKQKHILAMVLASRLIENEDWSRCFYSESKDSEGSSCVSLSTSPKKDRALNPLIQATKLGILELVMAILRKCPEAAESFDENGRNILHISVEQKHRFVYDYLMGSLDYKNRMLADVDFKGNTILHIAACLQGNPSPSPPEVTNQLVVDVRNGQSKAAVQVREKCESAAALWEMSWEVLWFKRVKDACYPYLWHLHDSDGKSAEELFEENHSALRRQAANGAKNLSSNGIVLAILMGTINFAALFTLPGGYDQNKGQAMLFKTNKQELQAYMLYLVLAVLFSLMSLKALLSVQVSRFDTNDFHTALPVKLTAANVGLIYCTSFTLAALCQGYILEGELGPALAGVLVFLVVAGGFAVVFAAMETYVHCFDYLYYAIRDWPAYTSLEL